MNIYEFGEAKRREYGIEMLPRSLAEAVDALEADEVVQAVLGEHIARVFVEAKRKEYADSRVEVSE